MHSLEISIIKVRQNYCIKAITVILYMNKRTYIDRIFFLQKLEEVLKIKLRGMNRTTLIKNKLGITK